MTGGSEQQGVVGVEGVRCIEGRYLLDLATVGGRAPAGANELDITDTVRRLVERAEVADGKAADLEAQRGLIQRILDWIKQFLRQIFGYAPGVHEGQGQGSLARQPLGPAGSAALAGADAHGGPATGGGLAGLARAPGKAAGDSAEGRATVGAAATLAADGAAKAAKVDEDGWRPIGRRLGGLGGLKGLRPSGPDDTGTVQPMAVDQAAQALGESLPAADRAIASAALQVTTLGALGRQGEAPDASVVPGAALEVEGDAAPKSASSEASTAEEGGELDGLVQSLKSAVDDRQRRMSRLAGVLEKLVRVAKLEASPAEAWQALVEYASSRPGRSALLLMGENPDVVAAQLAELGESNGKVLEISAKVDIALNSTGADAAGLAKNEKAMRAVEEILRKVKPTPADQVASWVSSERAARRGLGRIPSSRPASEEEAIAEAQRPRGG